MSSSVRLAREILVVASGMAFGVASAIIALMIHGESILGVLSVLYSLLMSAMYYLWVPLQQRLHFIRYAVLCAIGDILVSYGATTFVDSYESRPGR